MGNLGEGFDASGVEPSKSFEPIPKGKYPVIVESSEMLPFKNAEGSKLALKLQIIDGEYKGRKLFDNLNLEHSNKQTVEIAQRQLSALCHATGVMKPVDSAELHDIPVMAVVTIKPASGDYGPKNNIQTYEAMAGVAVAEKAAAISPESVEKKPWG